MGPVLLRGTKALGGKAGTTRRRLWEEEVAAAVAGNSRDGKKEKRKLKTRDIPQPHKDVNKPKNSDMDDPLVFKTPIHIFMKI